MARAAFCFSRRRLTTRVLYIKTFVALVAASLPSYVPIHVLPCVVSFIFRLPVSSFCLVETSVFASPRAVSALRVPFYLFPNSSVTSHLCEHRASYKRRSTSALESLRVRLSASRLSASRLSARGLSARAAECPARSTARTAGLALAPSLSNSVWGRAARASRRPERGT